MVSVVGCPPLLLDLDFCSLVFQFAHMAAADRLRLFFHLSVISVDAPPIPSAFAVLRLIKFWNAANLDIADLLASHPTLRQGSGRSRDGVQKKIARAGAMN